MCGNTTYHSTVYCWLCAVLARALANRYLQRLMVGFLTTEEAQPCRASIQSSIGEPDIERSAQAPFQSRAFSLASQAGLSGSEMDLAETESD